jgi:hypothetical protein
MSPTLSTWETWQAIRRRGPLCRRWRAYPNFHRDVGPKPSWRHLVIRDNPAGEFSPTNAGWRVAKGYRRRRLIVRS